MIDRLLTTEQVAQALGFSVDTIRRWRQQRRELPFVTLGKNDFRYRESDIAAYLDARLTSPVKAAV